MFIVNGIQCICKHVYGVFAVQKIYQYTLWHSDFAFRCLCIVLNNWTPYVCYKLYNRSAHIYDTTIRNHAVPMELVAYIVHKGMNKWICEYIILTEWKRQTLDTHEVRTQHIWDGLCRWCLETKCINCVYPWTALMTTIGVHVPVASSTSAMPRTWKPLAWICCNVYWHWNHW